MKPMNAGLYPNETDTQSFMKLHNIIDAIDQEKRGDSANNEEFISGDNSRYLINRDLFRSRHMSRERYQAKVTHFE